MTVIAKRLAQVVVGSPLHHLNLTLYPLLAEGPATPDYRLLDEALSDGSARIEEVSEAGSVPELCFINMGERPVLLLDGEELVGVKQNRILNLSVLAPAGQRIVIPVSCVEAGRWHADSPALHSARRTHYATGRARKSADVSESLRQYGSRYSDQRAVWRDIEGKSRRLGVVSRTGAAAAMYDCLRRRLDTYQGAFSPQAYQCGALFAINGRLQGLDLFDSPATLAAVLDKLVESYALDAIDWAEAPPADLPDAPQPWIDALAAAGIETFPALGEGEDWRLHSAGVVGGALVKEGRLIHLCAFRSAERGGPVGERPDPERRGPTGPVRTVINRRSGQRG